ncbi:hypothetical protein BGZ83_011623 [Gryganskiella cystojenkinii]|nr:hypothetical protein BGZ83_011623 [Gryganskiella cystojenkinii]
MMDRQSPTLSWGLSDDDLMASLSSFTAKLGDSLLAEQRQQLHGTDSLQNHNHNHNHNHNNSASYTSNTLTQDKTRKNLHQNQNTSLQSQNIGGVPVTAFDASLGLGSSSSSQSSSSAACLGSTPQIPVFSPPSLTERSPTTSTESLSPSPWMPWLAHEHDPLLQRISNNPETIYPALMETSMAPAAHQGLLIQDSNNNEAYIPTKLQLLSRTGGNPYMQYLQAIHPSQSQPQVEPQAQQQQVPTQVTGYVQPSMTMSSHQPAYVDPQWQATMMAMMMDQNPVLEPRHGEYRHAQRH